MQLPPSVTFFNFSNAPWPPIDAPSYGEWLIPGLAYNSSLYHIYYIPKSNPFERPAQMVLKACGSVNGGAMDILLYVGNAGIPWIDYPWKDGNMIELAILHVPDTQGHLFNLGELATGEAFDALMEMANKTDELRFGVACRSPDGGKMLWHSAHMCSSYR